MALTDLAAEQYVALTTYRRNGEPSSVPVWIADLGDGRVGFTTGASSLKAKRIANDPRVQLQPSNSRGAVKQGSTPVDGRAVVATGAEFEPVLAAVKAKYGWKFSTMMFVTKASAFVKRQPVQTSDAAIVIWAAN